MIQQEQETLQKVAWELPFGEPVGTLRAQVRKKGPDSSTRMNPKQVTR